MKNRQKALRQVMSTDGLTLEMAAVLYNEFFLFPEMYEKWYKVQPGDVVVDIGGCVGMMTAKALDAGASKIYMIEGNRKLIKTAIGNLSEYIMNEPDPRVYPINCIMGSSAPEGVYTTHDDVVGYDEVDHKTFQEFIEEYNINHIDYLKMDIEGNEYDVLNEESLEYISNNVKHLAMEVHIKANENTCERFLHFRDTFIKHFYESPYHKVRGAGDGQFINKSMWDDQYIRNLPLEKSFFMLYITRE